MQQARTPLRRSSRLASGTPERTETARALKHAQEQSLAAAFDPASTITSILRGDRAIIARLTKDKLQALVRSFADRALEDHQRITDLEQDLQHSEAQRAANTMSRGQYSRKMQEIMQKHGHKKAEASIQTADLPSPASIEPARPSPPITPDAQVISAPAAAPSSSIWKSLTSFIATPFSRKRAAEDEPDSPAPSQKRQKPEEPAEPAAPAERAQSAAPSKPAAQVEPAPAPPAALPLEPPATSSVRFADQPSITPAPRAVVQPSTAPPAAAAVNLPSTSTPAPKRKRTTAAAATPLPSIMESSPKPTSAITPRPRTVARARAAQSARKATSSEQTERRWAWEKKPEVKEPNADERLAKIREAEMYRRRLAQLEDEFEYVRKTKRVKVDHLQEIPHNRPGDASGTFRVPDIDSDDEMEVYDSVEERSNIFSAPQLPAQQPTTPLPQAQQATTPLPQTQQATQHLAQPPQLPAQQLKTPLPTAPQKLQQATPRFSFPLVAPRPADYSVTDAYKEACGTRFAAGLAAFTS